MKKSWFYWNIYSLCSTYEPFLINTYPDNYHNFQNFFMKIHEDLKDYSGNAIKTFKYMSLRNTKKSGR